MAERPRMGIYFYPQVDPGIDPIRDARAKRNRVKKVINETVGSGHAIDTQGKIVKWSDHDPSAIARQIELAQNYGINFFKVDQYVGASNGVPTVELQKPLDVIAQACDSTDFGFSIMYSLKRSPTIIPYSPDIEKQEKGRYFDFTRQTLDLIVDNAAKYWNNKKFVKVNDRPFIGIYGLTPDILKMFRRNNISNIGYYLTHMSELKYGVAPFFTAVVQSPNLAYSLFKEGFEATVTYAGLATIYDPLVINHEHPTIEWGKIQAIQYYQEQLAMQMLDWDILIKLENGFRFYPSAVKGFNASSRCVPGVDSSKALIYPYRPHIIDASPENFWRMLLEVSKYYAMVLSNIDFPILIATAQDFGDGNGVWPLKTPEGIDCGYLEQIKRLSNIFNTERYARARSQEDLKKS